MNITRAITMVLLLSAASCSPEAEQTQQQTDADSASDAAEPTVTFTREQFAQLSWLQGDWRGTLPDGRPFYERYRVTSDSTIHMYSFADSTMLQARDSSRMYWRDGRIYNGADAARSVVAGMDSAGVHFVPYRGRGHRYTWKQTEDGWTATLRPPGGPRLVYVMRPVK